MKLHTGVFLVAMIAANSAQAQTPDRDQPLQIEAAKANYDDLKQTSVWTGNVRLTRGSLLVRGERLELRQDAEGYQHATVTAAPGQLAAFRQRRDTAKPGVDEVFEGQADRLDYDGKNDTIRLVGQALLRRLENEQLRDELRGNLITYDSRGSTFAADGGDGRVRAIIAPREASPTASPPLSLKPAPTVGAERKQ